MYTILKKSHKHAIFFTNVHTTNQNWLQRGSSRSHHGDFAKCWVAVHATAGNSVGKKVNYYYLSKGAVNRKGFSECFLITIRYPLHVSAFSGEKKKKYIYIY
jgi:hypothetical protein